MDIENNNRSNKILGDRYILGDRLLHSATGDIYAAWDVKKGESANVSYDRPPPFFINFFPNSLIHSDAAHQIIEEEIKRLTTCVDWYQVIAFEKTKEGAYLVLKLPRGDFFIKRIAKSKIYGELSRVLPLLTNLHNTLTILKNCGIHHGRIEPDSLFLTENGSVGIIDSLYVIVKQRLLDNELTDAATVPNKEALYASPDICFGREASEQDDVFSLACLCYYLLSSKHPFGGVNSVSALLNKVRPQAIEMLSEAQWQHLEHGLSLSKDNRIETVSEFIKGFAIDAKPFRPLQKEKDKAIATARQHAKKLMRQQAQCKTKTKQAKVEAKAEKSQEKIKTVTKKTPMISSIFTKLQAMELATWAWIPLSLLAGIVVGILIMLTTPLSSLF
jgi:serine/threonine protein kinase